MNNKDLLIAALNKNQVTFSQMAKCAESLSKGTLKMKIDDGGKVFVFEYLDKKVAIEMKTLKMRGLNYLNDILIDDILTKVELDEVYAILDQVQADLLNKADKDHTHTQLSELTILNFKGTTPSKPITPFKIRNMLMQEAWRLRMLICKSEDNKEGAAINI